MPWLRLDDGFDSHPKLLELTELQRWRWTRVLIHCARHRTDGAVKTSVLREVGLARAVPALLELGLLDDNDGEYAVHDWHEYNSARDETNADRQARFRERSKVKKAHAAVAAAIKAGDLERQPCERCGSTYHVVAHHEDYAKPLDVVWLCHVHHAERHGEITAAVTAEVTESNGVTSNGPSRARADARVPVPSPEELPRAVTEASYADQPPLDDEPDPDLSEQPSEIDLEHYTRAIAKEIP